MVGNSKANHTVYDIYKQLHAKFPFETLRDKTRLLNSTFQYQEQKNNSEFIHILRREKKRQYNKLRHP